MNVTIDLPTIVVAVFAAAAGVAVFVWRTPTGRTLTQRERAERLGAALAVTAAVIGIGGYIVFGLNSPAPVQEVTPVVVRPWVGGSDPSSH